MNSYYPTPPEARRNDAFSPFPSRFGRLRGTVNFPSLRPALNEGSSAWEEDVSRPRCTSCRINPGRHEFVELDCGHYWCNHCLRAEYHKAVTSPAETYAAPVCHGPGWTGEHYTLLNEAVMDVLGREMVGRIWQREMEYSEARMKEVRKLEVEKKTREDEVNDETMRLAFEVAESVLMGIEEEEAEVEVVERILEETAVEEEVDVEEDEDEGEDAEEEANSSFMVECVSCMDTLEFGVHGSVELLCGHNWCYDCLNENIRQALTPATWPPKCCGEIDAADPKMILDAIKEEVMDLLRAREEWIFDKNPTYCPKPDCGMYIPHEEGPSEARFTHCPKLDCMASVCRVCKCRTIEHRIDPSTFDLMCPDPLGEENRKLVEDLKWQQCPKDGCVAVIEKSEGCDHMKCSECGTDFCYLCKRLLEAPYFQCECEGGAPPLFEDDEEMMVWLADEDDDTEGLDDGAEHEIVWDGNIVRRWLRQEVPVLHREVAGVDIDADIE